MSRNVVPSESPDDGNVYNRSLSTNNSRTNTITSQHPTPSSYQTYNHHEPFRPVTLRTTNLPPRGQNADAHNRNVTPNSELHSTAQGRASGPPPKSSVTSGSSSQCQDSTQVPGVSSVPSDPQSASRPSSSQPSSQLGLTRAPSDHIHTTLATRLNEKQARELPGKVDTGDTSRGMAPPDERCDAGPSVAPSGVPTSKSSKHAVTPSGSSRRRQKSAQGPRPYSPSLDPSPTSKPSCLNEPPDRVLPELSDSGNETRGIGHCDEQHDAAPRTAPASPKHFVTSSNPSSMHQESAQAPRLSSPRLNPPPVTMPLSSQSPPPPTLMLASSHQIPGTRAALLNEPRESSGRVLPELPCSGNEGREIVSFDERRDAGPSVSPRRDSGSQEYPTASKSPPLRQKPTQAPPFAAFASPGLGPPLASTSSLQIPSRVALMGAPPHSYV